MQQAPVAEGRGMAVVGVTGETTAISAVSNGSRLSFFIGR